VETKDVECFVEYYFKGLLNSVYRKHNAENFGRCMTFWGASH
jgi:hypothetical protein